jgi:hypothetical protein
MFIVADKPETKWDSTKGDDQPIVIAPLDKGSLKSKKIFTMGSCFAVRIRQHLGEMGFDTYPKYYDMQFDQRVSSIGKLPTSDNVNHYSITSILQEFKNVEQDGTLFKPEYFFDFTGKDLTRALQLFVKRILQQNGRDFAARWQDPFRRDIYGKDFESICHVSKLVTRTIGDAIRSCDIFVFTLGMTEIWRERRGGLAICNSYGGKADAHLCYFDDLDFSETKKQVIELVQVVKRFNSQAEIVFTVSPVPLARTSRPESVVVANQVSKSKQRAAVDEVCREFPNVHYFPSFELARDRDFYKPDGRHVRVEKTLHIVETFARWYSGGLSQETDARRASH